MKRNQEKLLLVYLEKKIIEIDNSFKLPEVLKPYRAFCSVEYEGYSLAEESVDSLSALRVLKGIQK